MSGLARLCLRNRVAAALVTISSAVLPPITTVWGGAALALTALELGAAAASQTLLLTVLGLLLLGWPLFGPGALSLSISLVVVYWLAPLVLALVLARSHSLALTLLVSALLAGLGTLAFELAIGDSTQWWLQLFAQLRPLLVESGLDPKPFEQWLNAEAAYISGWCLLLQQGLWLLGLLQARAWQAAVYRPGAFASEWQALRMGRVLALLWSLLLGLAWVWTTPLWVSAALFVGLLFALQGMAVIHALVAQQRLARAWLVLMYVLLGLLAPQMLMLLALLGWIDTGVELRRARSTT